MSAAARQVLAANTVEALPLAAAGMLAALTRVAADGGVLALGRSYDGNPWEVRRGRGPLCQGRLSSRCCGWSRSERHRAL
jgi:hypothetical protein